MRLRLVTIVLLTSFSAFTVASGSAPSEQTGYIKSIQVLSDGRTIVNMVDVRADKPDCANYPYWFIADEDSVAAKNQISILLSAHVAKRSITIRGSGLCLRWVDGEDISSVEILD